MINDCSVQGSYNKRLSLFNVISILLLPNTTFEIQPLNIDVIADLKKQYHRF